MRHTSSIGSITKTFTAVLLLALHWATYAFTRDPRVFGAPDA